MSVSGARRREQLHQFDRARAAGLPPVRAARWAAYADMKAARGEAVSLAEAVAQPLTVPVKPRPPADTDDGSEGEDQP